jgi:hypothetical protein
MVARSVAFGSRSSILFAGKSLQYGRIAEEDRGALFEHRRFAQRSQTNLGADAGGVAHSEAEDWFRTHIRAAPELGWAFGQVVAINMALLAELGRPPPPK